MGVTSWASAWRRPSIRRHAIPATASATLFADGSAVVRSATSDMGPGTTTAMTQVAADALGLPVARVRFELGDSALPEAKEHGGSTTTASVGSAVQAACEAVLAKLEDLRGANGRGIADVEDALRRAGLARLDAAGRAAPGEEKQRFSTYGFGAVFAEVRVDLDFGTVRAMRILGAYDAGRIVNPKLARSQCIGGMVGGIGMALLEEANWDERLGRVTNATIAEYLVPVNADVIDLDAVFVPGEDPVMNPIGVKGLAELGLCGRRACDRQCGVERDRRARARPAHHAGQAPAGGNLAAVATEVRAAGPHVKPPLRFRGA